MNPIITEKNCSGLGARLADCGRVFVVCDANVAGFVNDQVLPQVGDCPVLRLQTSEAAKSLQTVQDICSWLLDNGADRKSFVLAVGGGLTSDMAGFAASIYMRGISFAYVPTTLLSMVDAAIGGKTGVNFLQFKNMLGTFCEPQFTWIATDALKTLPRRDLLSGASEMLKTFIIENANDNYAKAVAALSAGGEDLSDLIHAAAMVKGGIVTRDFRESGERRKLNLGHTFAHAIEHLAQEHGDDIAHGEAVAMGMVLAARLSEKCGLAENGLAERLEADFKSCGLRVECPYGIDEMSAAMGKDKKADGAEVNFVLIRAVGDVTTQKMKPADVAEMLK